MTTPAYAGSHQFYYFTSNSFIKVTEKGGTQAIVYLICCLYNCIRVRT